MREGNRLPAVSCHYMLHHIARQAVFGGSKKHTAAKAAVRAIENVGVFSPYIYPNQCTDASALPCGFRLACQCLSDWFYRAAIRRQKNPPAQSLLRYAGRPVGAIKALDLPASAPGNVRPSGGMFHFYQ